MSYFDTLYEASYNGAPFFVRQGRNTFGRRLAVHRYPNRDTVWPEDMGRRPREFAIEGFIVGDDVLNQLAAFTLLAELPGPGILIHPTLGIQSVNLQDLTTEERYDQGRQIVLHFRFITAGARQFPSILTASGGGTQNNVTSTQTAVTGDFVSAITSSLSTGLQAAEQAAITAATLVAIGNAAIKNVSNIASAVSSIAGPFGRYAGGGTGSSTGSIQGSVTSAVGVSSQVSTLLSGATALRSVASSAGINLSAIAGAL